jgi:hypothetical protein
MQLNRHRDNKYGKCKGSIKEGDTNNRKYNMNQKKIAKQTIGTDRSRKEIQLAIMKNVCRTNGENLKATHT